MKKIIILVISIFLLSSFIVTASTNSDIYNITVWYSDMENTSVTDITPIPTTGSCPSVRGAVAGKLGNALDFEHDSNDYCSVATDAKFHAFVNGFSVVMWVKPESTYASNIVLMGKMATWDTAGFASVSIGGADFRQYYYTGGGSGGGGGGTYDTNWHLFIGCVNATNRRLLIDNVSVMNDGIAPNYGTQINTVNLTLAQNIAGLGSGANYDGLIDQVMVLNGSICTDVTKTNYLWNAGNGINITSTEGSEADTTSDPTFISPTPANNAYNNTQAKINCSHVSPNVTFYLYTDGLPVYINVTGNYSYGVSYITNFMDGSHTYSCSVQNITTGISSSNITRTFTLDTTEPSITFTSSNNWGINNNSKIMPYKNNLTVGVIFYDDNLYNTLINITNITHQSMYSILNTTITGNTTANYTRNVSLTGWALGNYTLEFWASDGHTKKEIKDYIVIKGTFRNYLTYITDSDTTITITLDEDIFDIKDMSTEKKTDRYIFNVEYNSIKQTRKIIVESSQPIYIINSEYIGHLITGKHWIDFQEYKIFKQDVIIQQLTPYKVEVILNNLNDKKYQFNSLGGLNINTKQYNLELTSFIKLNAKDFYTNSSINFNATLNGNTYQSTTSGLELNNISAGMNNFVINSAGYNTFYLDYTVNNSYNNVTMYLSPLNVLDECEYYTVKTLNVSFYNITDNSNITLDYRYIFEYQYSDIDSFFSNEGTNDQFSLCLDSLNRSIIGNLIFDYGNAPQFSYYINQLTLNNVTQNLKLYLTSETSEVTFYVYDEYSNKLEGALIYIYYFDISDNEYKLSQIIKTNNVGVAVGNIILDTERYKFSVVYNGKTYLTTSGEILYSTSKTFRITLEESQEIVQLLISKLDIKLNGDEDNQTFNLDWNYPQINITSLNLKIYSTNITGENMLYNFTSTSKKNSTNYTVSNIDGIYVGSVYVTYNGETYFVTSDSIDIREEYTLFGKEAAVISFIFIGTMVLIGLTVGAEVALILNIFGLIIFFVLGFYAVSLAALVSLIIVILIVIFLAKRY